MPGAHGRTPASINNKDVPRFAPNFTVYVLPPDAVCLYSEDRKFFLYGELYCKLAAAIGKGGKSVLKLVRELEREFPADKIREALQRLFDRRYVVAQFAHGRRHHYRLLDEPRAFARKRQKKICKIAACASSRSRCRAAKNSPRHCGNWAFASSTAVPI